ncbi:LutC/YkgG family protein [Flavihumibacter profundi]|jgi:L-lactate dehydrogenase complex protein LldG|uniref:LutC/YkgG family protein n=1 Tax=Flavihumibacter profundi TaxID=2716883 RepID=UPI001CC41F2B|nr:LUD domain-containing protein [Flavihumibacter profundi]MBZ5858769.1 LUD domain-containing protein [Flavihumibacter profundi]
MSARNTIIETVAKNKPALIPLPEMDFSQFETPVDLFEAFSKQLLVVGGRLIEMNDESGLSQLIQQEKSAGVNIINRVTNMGEPDVVPENAAALHAVDKAYISGAFGVAENGAIWVWESAMGQRILPFICQQLVLVLRRKQLVANMHLAYNRINVQEEGFGVFIAGPSKTADIEQSLVIGAHGPKALSVIILH